MKGLVAPLHEGIFSVGLDKQFRRISRDEAPPKGTLKVALNPFLVQYEGQNILIDAGLGLFGIEDHHAILLENLSAHGLSERDIHHVYCSHLHYDHTGGLVHKSNGYMEMTFPDAVVHLSGKGWEKLKSYSHEENPEPELVDFIEARAELSFFEDDGTGLDFIERETIGGHTEFSQLFRLNLNGNVYLMAGDVLASRGAVNRRYSAKYDFNGKKSMELREKIGRMAFEEGAVILAYHDTEHAMFKLVDYDENKGYIIENVGEVHVKP